MKKLLIAMLALITALSISLTACNKEKDPDPAEDPDDDELVARPSDDDNTNDDTNEGEGEDEGDDTPSTQTGSWEVKNDTIYVLTNCNIRSSASTTSQKVATAKFGDSFQRIETNGKWSKITYNNAEAYILNDLVTDSAARATFNDRSSENLVLHVKSNGNAQNPIQVTLRNAPLSGESIKDVTYVVTITAAETANGEMKLMALSQDGKWARVSYTGTVGTETFDGTETLYVHWEYIQELNPGNAGDQLPG